MAHSFAGGLGVLFHRAGEQLDEGNDQIDRKQEDNAEEHRKWLPLKRLHDALDRQGE